MIDMTPLTLISLLAPGIYFIILAAGEKDAYFNWSRIIYDESYLVNHLDERFSYLKLDNGSYLGPRDYFNFSHVFEPNEAYFKRVNLEDHLYDELRAMEISSSIATMDQWHYSDKEELSKSGWPEADEQRCNRELQQIQALLDKASQNSSFLFERNSSNNVELLRYIDSWARPPSETYSGHSYWVGSYRSCQLARLRLTDGNSTPANEGFRYCWAKLRAKSWPDEDEMEPPTSIRAGICLPKSCDTLNANERLEAIHRIMLFNFSPLHRDRFNKLIGVYCLPNQAGLSLACKLFIGILSAWIALVLSLSVLAAHRGNRKLPSVMYCLTLQENFRLFVADDHRPSETGKQGQSDNGAQQVDLRPLGLVRLMASIAVCVAHSACSFGWVFNSSRFTIINYRSLPWQIIPSILKALDLYLVIGGLLSSYIIISRFGLGEKGRRMLMRPTNYVKLITARYLRLAPMLILVLAFMKAVYPYLSDGPMWDYGTYKYSIQGQCRQSSWWRVLGLPIVFDLQGNSYLNECLSVSWYLVADLKISFLVPPIIYLMLSPRKRTKWLITAALVFVSTLNQYKDLSMQRLIYFKQFFHYGQLFGVNILNLTFGEPGYFSAINRLHAVVFGLLAGVQLHRYRAGTIEPGKSESTNSKDRKQARQQWPFWMRGPFFWAAILWEVYDFFVPVLVQHNYLSSGQAPSEETIKLAMVLKPRFDAVIFSIILMRFVTDLAPRLMQNTLAFYKLSKLSYCVFLVHTIIISYAVSANERSRLDSIELQFLMNVTFVISVSVLISFPLYLFVESPVAQLLSTLMKANAKRRVSGSVAMNKQQTEGKEMARI